MAKKKDDFGLTYKSIWKAENARRAADAKPRRCLRCAKPFYSEGKHNRICLRCNEINNRQSYLDI